MTEPGILVTGTNGAGRFANGVTPDVPGGWNGLDGVIGWAVDGIILIWREKQRDNTSCSLWQERSEPGSAAMKIRFYF